MLTPSRQSYSSTRIEVSSFRKVKPAMEDAFLSLIHIEP